MSSRKLGCRNSHRQGLYSIVLLCLAPLGLLVALSACRDIDEPPPLPIHDPDAHILDAGPDTAEDGPVT